MKERRTQRMWQWCQHDEVNKAVGSDGDGGCAIRGDGKREKSLLK